MSHNDKYYNILNIKKDATEKQIKSGYRKKALKFHPDKAPVDKKEEYESHFKEISEAYNVLRDPKKRKIYDAMGEEGIKNMENGSAGGNDPFSMFSHIFGGGFPGGMGGFPPGARVHVNGMPFGMNAKHKLPDIDIRVTVTLEEAYKGVAKKVKYSRNIMGDTEDIEFELEVPPGCPPNVQMVRQGEGHQDEDSIPGNVKFIIMHKKHSTFTVNKHNLVIEKEIQFGSSLLGVEFTVKHLNGKLINIKTEGIIFNDDMVISSGLGMPVQGTYGNLIIKYKVNKNISLTPQKIKLIKSIFKHDNFPYNPEAKHINMLTPEEFHEQQQQQSEDDGNQKCQVQ